MRLTVGIGPRSVTITINMAINVKILALIQLTLGEKGTLKNGQIYFLVPLFSHLNKSECVPVRSNIISFSSNL